MVVFSDSFGGAPTPCFYGSQIHFIYEELNLKIYNKSRYFLMNAVLRNFFKCTKIDTKVGLIQLNNHLLHKLDTVMSLLLLRIMTISLDTEQCLIVSFPCRTSVLCSLEGEMGCERACV